MVHERGGYYICSGGGGGGGQLAPPAPWVYNAAIEKCVDEKRRAGYVDAANVKLGAFLDWPTVIAVVEDTPAAKAGIKAGDRLRELDGTPLPTFTDFMRALRDRRAGDRLAVGLERQGQSLTATLVLDRRRGNEENCVECVDTCVTPLPSPFFPCMRYLH
jgi:predicted metalloprotease with PDZ domain